MKFLFLAVILTSCHFLSKEQKKDDELLRGVSSLDDKRLEKLEFCKWNYRKARPLEFELNNRDGKSVRVGLISSWEEMSQNFMAEQCRNRNKNKIFHYKITRDIKIGKHIPLMIFRDTVLDGEGHSLFGLSINENEARKDKEKYKTEKLKASSLVRCTGFFNVVKGHVQNLSLKGVKVQGVDGVGALVGCLSGGVVESSSVQGNEVGSRSDKGYVYGKNSVGGLVGSVEGGALINTSYSDISVGLVKKVESLFDVSEDVEVAGGLVGDISKSDIKNSYAVGSVDGREYTGGLVGYVSSPVKIINSYALGDVKGDWYVGGLIGRVKLNGVESLGNKIHIENSYAFGFVNESGKRGSHYAEVRGLIGSEGELGLRVVKSFSRKNFKEDSRTWKNLELNQEKKIRRGLASVSVCRKSKNRDRVEKLNEFIKSSFQSGEVWELKKGYHPRLRAVGSGFKEICN